MAQASLLPDLVQDDPPSTFARVVGRESTAGVLPRLGSTLSLAPRAGTPDAIPVRDAGQSSWTFPPPAVPLTVGLTATGAPGALGASIEPAGPSPGSRTAKGIRPSVP
ncbi:MAG TPA: hypothetical protein VKF17_00735 [Isosphaeraceae bacterium]|nr:hypothetical protein [Isosphaeraceae bacterium]